MPGLSLRGLLFRGVAAGKAAPPRLAGSLSSSPSLRLPAGQPQPTAARRGQRRGGTSIVALNRESSSSIQHFEYASADTPLLESSLSMHGGLTMAVLVVAAGLLILPEPAAAAISLDQVLEGVEELVANAGYLGPVVFIAAYVVATVFLVPGSVLTLAAGALFGPFLGTAVVSVASTLGASAAFLVGRYLARPAVEARISANRKFAAVDAAIAAKGPRIVLLLRLSPLFPFTLLNYALSLTKVEFGPYVLSSWVGMLPGTVAFVALGGAGRAAAETASGSGLDPLKLGLYVVGAVATLWATKIISQTATKALQEASDEVAAENEDASAPLNR